MKHTGTKAYAQTMNLAREPVFRLGAIEVRPATREIVHPGGRETVEPRVMSVLVRFAQAGGQVVTRDDLITACWEGRVVSDDAINRVISRVRKLADLTGGRDFSLETITKVGYRLVVSGAADAPVLPATAGDAQASPAPAPAVASVLSGVRRYWLVAAGAVVAGLLGAWAFWGMNRAPEWNPDPSAPLTLAVLPFDNLGGVEGDDTLAIGLAREIRNTLSRVRGLRVVSDASSFAVASEPLTATEIGRRLKADLLLDGSLIRNGDSLSLTVELVDGWDGVNLWADSRSGPAGDLGRLRQRLAEAVFERIVVQVGPDRVERISEAPASGDPRAYRLLMEATELLEGAAKLRMTGQSDAALDAGDKANGLVDSALVIEPNSPAALRLKARISGMAITHEIAEKAPAVGERQEAAANYLRRALAIDPDYAPALGALGEYYRRYRWEWGTAGSMLARSLALDPNQADTQLSYSYFLTQVGRCVEAVEHARLAISLDPEFGWRTLGLPRALKCAGRYDEAQAAYIDALRQAPESLVTLRDIYLEHLVRRDADGLDAVRALVRDELWKGAPPAGVADWLEWTGAAARAMRGEIGNYATALEKEMRVQIGIPDGVPLAVALRDRGESLWVLAMELAFTGNNDRAIDMLAAAVAAGVLYVPETMPFGAYEFTAEMRADPSYQAIWRSDTRLAELSELRLGALQAGQMHGVLPDGTVVTPKSVPVDSRS